MKKSPETIESPKKGINRRNLFRGAILATLSVATPNMAFARINPPKEYPACLPGRSKNCPTEEVSVEDLFEKESAVGVEEDEVTEIAEVMDEAEIERMQKSISSVRMLYTNPFFHRYLKNNGLTSLTGVLRATIQNFDKLQYLEENGKIIITSGEEDIETSIKIIIQNNQIVSINGTTISSDQFYGWEYMAKNFRIFLNKWKKGALENDPVKATKEEKELVKTMQMEVIALILELHKLTGSLNNAEKTIFESDGYKALVEKTRTHSLKQVDTNVRRGAKFLVGITIKNGQIVISIATTMTEGGKLITLFGPDGSSLKRVKGAEGSTFAPVVKDPFALKYRIDYKNATDTTKGSPVSMPDAWKKDKKKAYKKSDTQKKIPKANAGQLVEDFIENPDKILEKIELSESKKTAARGLIRYYKQNKEKKWMKDGLVQIRQDIKRGDFNPPQGAEALLYLKNYFDIPILDIAKIGLLLAKFGL